MAKSSGNQDCLQTSLRFTLPLLNGASKYQGQMIVFKLNSLVDFLESKSEDFTTTQSRRFLVSKQKVEADAKHFFTS